MNKNQNWLRNSQLGGLEMARTCIYTVAQSPFSTGEQVDLASRLLLDLRRLQESCLREKRDPETGETIPHKKAQE